MFVDDKLNQYFNNDDESRFISRLVQLAKADPTCNSFRLCESPLKDECRDYAIDVLSDFIQKRKGTVYIASNDSNTNSIKIGRTARGVESRERSLNSAGVQGYIKIVWYADSIDSVLAEAFIHQRLKNQHVEKEFYDVAVDDAKTIAEQCVEQVILFYQRIAHALDIIVREQ